MSTKTFKQWWATWGGWIEGSIIGVGAWLFLGRYDEHAAMKSDLDHWLIEKVIYAALLGGFAAAIAIALRLRSVVRARDRALNAFRGSQDLYRHIVEHAHEMIFEVDMEGRITYANKAAEHFMERPIAGILGKAYSDFVPVRYRASVHREFVVQAARMKPVHYLEAPAISGSGSLLWFAQTIRLKTEDGRSTGFIVISRDITDRRAMEESLKASEERLRAIFDQAPLGMVVTDREGRLLSMNARYAAMLGLDPAHVRGRRFMEFTHPEDLLKNASLFNDLIEGRADSYRLEKRNLRKDGTSVWVRVTVSKLTLGKKEEGFAIGMVEDIDEWKRTEEMNRQLQSIVEETSDLVATADVNGHLTYLNPAGRRLLGIGPSDPVEGVSPQDFFPQEMIGALKGGVRTRVVSEGRWEGQIPLLTRNGSRLVVSQVILGHRNEKGDLQYFSTIARDVTKEREAVAALERERELLRTLIEAIPDEIAIKDTERRFVLANSATLKALRQSRIEDVLGKRDEELIPEPFAVLAKEEEERVLATGTPIINTGSNKPRRDPATGRVLRSILVTKVPLRDAEGNVRGLVVINRNITELRQAEDEKEQLIRDLQKALADVKTLSGLLPICASCKKIRDDDGYWNKIESYIESHTAAQFSHGLCPDCIGKYFPVKSANGK